VEYTDFIADFAGRTLQNLDRIQSLARDGADDVYPVTQLWNSLLGLIVLPRERDLRHIAATPMSDLVSQGWPGMKMSGSKNLTLRDLVRRLRVAVAHFNVDFKAGANHEISYVTVWTEALGPDGKPMKGSRDWVGEITVEGLERLARRVAEAYLKQFTPAAA
jgi:hypothetical protein